jgi:hypothetical protein
MMRIQSLLRFGLLFILPITLFYCPAAQANSLEINGPGFKMQNNTGWFGRHSVNYSDALGNGVNRSTGIFGRTTTRTKVFGAETYRHGQNVSVTAPGGTPLVYTHRGIFGGRTTRIDGNNMFQSLKGIFNSPSPQLPTTP